MLPTTLLLYSSSWFGTEAANVIPTPQYPTFGIQRIKKPVDGWSRWISGVGRPSKVVHLISTPYYQRFSKKRSETADGRTLSSHFIIARPRDWTRKFFLPLSDFWVYWRFDELYATWANESGRAAGRICLLENIYGGYGATSGTATAASPFFFQRKSRSQHGNGNAFL